MNGSVLLKIVKICGLTLLGLVVGLFVFYLYLTDFGNRRIFSGAPRRPKIEIPETYKLEWVGLQEKLIIDSFAVNIIISKLNLFNSQSLISYKIIAHADCKGAFKPIISKVHIAERQNKDALADNESIIEITPVLDFVKNKSGKKGMIKFEFKNEYMISSLNWGINKVKFICGRHEQILVLNQEK